MFLKSLKIENDTQVIRDIPFHKGLNLIIDNTSTDNLQESGNNVGKTTVLRLIDFCLGSDGVNVYQDPEFKEKSNTQIETFLKDNNVLISLILVADIEDEYSQEIKIRRNFRNRKEKIQEINGEYYNERDFDSKLKQLIFSSNADKPTFRQIISKNIRYEKNRLSNTLRVLHNTTKFEEYEALYFFWLGIDTDSANRKQRLQSAKSVEQSILKRLKKDSSISEIKQALSVIDRDILELNFLKSNFNINESYANDLDNLNKIKSDISKISSEINRLSVRKNIILEAKHELEKEFANIDTSLLEKIYKAAKSFIPSMHVKFEELLSFHNNMLKEKVLFLTEELPEIDSILLIHGKNLKNFIHNEQVLSNKLKKAGAVEELEVIIQKLNLKFEQKGKYEEQLHQWESSIQKLKTIEEELHEINEGIESQDKLLESRIADFNKYFSKLSQKLYDEQFILSQNKNERAYELKISTIGGNLGTGKKKGQIAAFDFAYIQFCDELDLPCLHFLLYDQIENIHDNQLTLISEVANETNSQFIAPVLRDKLPPDLKTDDYMILSLSQEDKLFKV